MDQTFVMFKPDCIERGLLTKVMSRFEDKGLRLVALKMLRVTPDLAKQHYAEHVEKPFYPSLSLKELKGGLRSERSLNVVCSIWPSSKNTNATTMTL